MRESNRFIPDHCLEIVNRSLTLAINELAKGLRHLPAAVDGSALLPLLDMKINLSIRASPCLVSSISVIAMGEGW